MTHQKNFALIGAIALLTSLTIGGDVHAQQTDAQKETVTYSGETLFRIRTGAGGYTAAQRAQAIQDRLNPILSLRNLKADDIYVRQERPYQDADIYVRDRLLVTVDRGMAQANGNNDPGDLARAWADRMRRILPQVSVKPESSPFHPRP